MPEDRASAPSLPGCTGPLGCGCLALPFALLLFVGGAYVIVASPRAAPPAPTPAPVVCVCLDEPPSSTTQDP